MFGRLSKSSISSALRTRRPRWTIFATAAPASRPSATSCSFVRFTAEELWTRRTRGLRRCRPHKPTGSKGVYQTPGTNRFDRAEYAAYSSPNCPAIIFSSAPTRRATRTATAIPFEKPATQFGITRA